MLLATLILAAVAGQFDSPPIPVQSPFHWTPASESFALEPGPAGSWDEHIRERMWVMYEDGEFKAWYCGFEGAYDQERPNLVHLGYATSKDGIHWTKHPKNPIFAERWTEDMCIVKSDGQYVMYVEDETHGNTVIYLMTSTDGIAWTQHGNIMAGVPGSDWEPEWAGTPLVWKEGEQWLMLYEGGPPGDTALATSTDGRAWVRSPKNPVLTEGSGWDNEITAPDSIVKHDGVYYLFYHARGDKWRSGMAMSRDLITWHRYDKNPLFDNPSPVIVMLKDRALMYVMHENIKGVNGVLVYESPLPPSTPLK